jgi:hypothetical protein
VSDPTFAEEIASLRARGYTGDFGVASDGESGAVRACAIAAPPTRPSN